MDLRALLAGLTSAAVPQVPEVTGVCCDSQRIRPGDVFVAIPGFREDGRCHIAEAKARGAVCVLSREPVQELPWAAVQDPRRALAEVSARLYRHPDRELAVVGVTGTNGKTTTTCLVRHILRQTLGVRVGLIGTIRNLIDETELETERTTPESCDVYRLLRQMADAGCRYGVMEVSSHALALERVWGINFRVGAFTNLTRDHLDFHRTMEDYCDAKAQLFRQCEAAVCNGDDPWTPRLLRECACPVLRYGTGDSSRLRGENLRLTARSVTFDALLDGRRIPVTVPIPGRFTVYNALAALGICHMLGVPPEQGAAALQTASGIKGRMEVVPTPGLPCTVLIDYAHTPDALENVLTAVRGFAEGRVVAVFGCGGDRDREKRPQMGRIVSRLADVAVVTSDNPRWEQPEKIIEDIPVVFPAPDWKVYQEMQTAKLLEVDSETITAMQAATLTGKLLQLCNGAMYDAEKQVHPLNRCKLDAFGELIDALDGQKALVFYGFDFDKDFLQAELKTREKGLRFAVLKGREEADAWNRGELDVLLAQPASCAYGLNLQAGGHHLIWYSLPWNLELYEQGNARLYRQGQQHPVIIHRLLVKGGADELVAKALESKSACQQGLIQGIKALAEEAHHAAAH